MSADTASPFRLTVQGVERRADGKARAASWRWVCSPLTVLEVIRGEDGSELARRVRLRDSDGREKDLVLPIAMMGRRAVRYRATLLSLGLTITPGGFGRSALRDYILTTGPAEL